MKNTPWKIELLGCLRAEQEGRQITRFQTQKTGLLLAYLAMYRQRPHMREQLVELLWPDDDERSARHKLRMALSSLRRQLEPPGVPAGTIIMASRFSVQLNPTAVTTDVAEFEAGLQAAAHASGDSQRAQHLAEAVERYGGELLPGYYEEWIEPERQRLTATYLTALGQLSANLEQARDYPRAIEYARRAVAADPLHEDAHYALIRLLKAAGQLEAALRQYLELERLLEEELDTTPDAEIRELARELQRAKAIRREEELGKAEEGTVEPSRPGAAPASPREASLGAGPDGRPSGTPPFPRHAPAPGGHPVPAGTLTFLMTEFEDLLGEPEREAGRQRAPQEYQELLRPLFRGHGGHELQITGTALHMAFGRASDAAAAAVAGQRDLASHAWALEVGLPGARMALHTGEVAPGEEVLYSPAFAHAARLLQTAHPGQILASEKSAGLLRGELRPELQLLDLGLYRLREQAAPERLFQLHNPEAGRQTFAPPNALPGVIGNVPPQFTRLFGREGEIGHLQRLLMGPTSRLVTLIGSGGEGKTRLALEVAGRLLEPLRGAVWFVPLADIDDPRMIMEAVIEALRLPRAPGLDPLEQVVRAFSQRAPGERSLLILDSLEHLLPDGAPLLGSLLERVPSLTLLVTSRRRMSLSGEHELPLLPLRVPEDPESPEQLMRYEAVQLFVDRAQVARSDFQVTPANATAVAELCRRLEGIPLALELAAARAGVLTPAQMLERLAQPFELLVSRQRDMAPRHQTMRAAIDWSHHLLSPQTQRFFAQLSVFRGGWTLEAAEAVCSDFGFRVPEIQNERVLEHLGQLQECSLIRTEAVGAELRFWTLETLREYAEEQLEPGERATVAERHAAYYLRLAEEAERELQGPDQGAWLDRLEREHANVQAALGWFEETGQREAGLRLAAAVWRFWSVRGHWDIGRARLAEALALVGAAGGEARARALHGLGVLAEHQGDLTESKGWLEESLAIWREMGCRSSIARLLGDLGRLALQQGELGTARAACDEGLAVCWELLDCQGIAFWLRVLGDAALHRGDPAAARPLHEESLVILRACGDRQGIAGALDHLGHVAMAQGEYGRARAFVEESLPIQQELGDRRGIARSLYHLAEMARDQGDLEPARRLYEESLRIRRGLGDKLGAADCLRGLSIVAGGQDQADIAAQLFAEAESLCEEREILPSSPVGGGVAGPSQSSPAGSAVEQFLKS